MFFTLFGPSGPDSVSVVYSSLVMRGSQGPASPLSRYALHNVVAGNRDISDVYTIGLVAAKFPDQTHENAETEKKIIFGRGCPNAKELGLFF